MPSATAYIETSDSGKQESKIESQLNINETNFKIVCKNTKKYVYVQYKQQNQLKLRIKHKQTRKLILMNIN